MAKPIIRERPEVKEEIVVGGYCVLHPSIENNKECYECHKLWPVKKHTRAQCKSLHWVGRVNHKKVNELTPAMTEREKIMLK